jgi:hypothetical protein
MVKRGKFSSKSLSDKHVIEPILVWGNKKGLSITDKGFIIK